MRAYELLLENRTLWWANKYMKELYSVTMKPENHWFLELPRPPRVNQQSSEQSTEQLVAETVAKWIEQYDPTPNKKYTGWLIREYATESVPQLEDMPYLGSLLETFDSAKRHPEFPFEKDILKLDSSQLFELAEWWESIKPEKKLTDRGDYTVIDENDAYTAIWPKNEQAACFWGQSTRWCTAATKSDNYFNQYNRRSPLLILIPKNPKYEREKFQMYFSIEYLSDEGATFSRLIVNQKQLNNALIHGDMRFGRIRWGEFSNDRNDNIGLRGFYIRFGLELIQNTLRKFAEAANDKILTWQISAIIKAASDEYDY